MYDRPGLDARVFHRLGPDLGDSPNVGDRICASARSECCGDRRSDRHEKGGLGVHRDDIGRTRQRS
jgi:hypothetical protein